MKHIKTLLFIAALCLTVYSSFALVAKNSNNKVELSIETEVRNSKKAADFPLHGDVWFAFSTIAVLGSYLVFKKQ